MEWAGIIIRTEKMPETGCSTPSSDSNDKNFSVCLPHVVPLVLVGHMLHY